MFCLIRCQGKGKAAGRYAQLTVDLEPNLCGGVIHRCLQSADGGQCKILYVGIYNNVPIVVAGTIYALPDAGDT